MATKNNKPSTILIIGLPFIAACVISIPILYMLPPMPPKNTEDDQSKKNNNHSLEKYIVPSFTGDTFVEYQFNQIIYLINRFDTNGDGLLTGIDWLNFSPTRKYEASLDFMASVYMSFMYAISGSPLSSNDSRIIDFIRTHEHGTIPFLDEFFSIHANQEEAIWQVVQFEYLKLDISPEEAIRMFNLDLAQ